MKHGHALAIGMLALALAACGGSNHHSSGSGTTVTDPTLGLTGDYRIEAVLSTPAVDPGYLYQDPQDIQIRDNVTFQLVSYTGSGATLVRHVVPTAAGVGDTGVTFATSDTLNASGGLSETDGIFTASGTDSGTRRYVVTATYQGQSYSRFYQVNPRLNQVRIHGIIAVPTGTTVTITDPATGASVPSPVYQGVYNSELDFYEQRDPLAPETQVPASPQINVQQVRSGPDGTFRASVPLPSNGAGGVPTVRLLALPPDGFDSSFTFGGVSTTAFSSPAQADLITLPSIAATLSSGDYYLVPSADITRVSDTTFYINSVANLDADTANIIQLSGSARGRKAATKKP